MIPRFMLSLQGITTMVYQREIELLHVCMSREGTPGRYEPLLCRHWASQIR